MYFFHKGVMGLGWMTPNPHATGHVPEEPYAIPFGQANIRREGSDLTILTISLMVHRSLDAAEKLAQEGINTEVVDLRTLVPLDRETIINSIKKTHRVLIVDEDYKSFGMSGELAAIVAEEALDYLDAPPKRLAVPDVPIPYSRPMEQYVIPSVNAIAAAARDLVAS
jgi:pyruvate dehydrogenase E1 component beta subunit